jgi:hypothetical protein
MRWTGEYREKIGCDLVGSIIFLQRVKLIHLSTFTLGIKRLGASYTITMTPISYLELYIKKRSKK